jgi:hypothetical protein
MPIINLKKVLDMYVNNIRDFNIYEKIELSRILLNAIEYEHGEELKELLCKGGKEI